MVGHHSLDANSSQPVSVSNTNEQGITNGMRGPIYGQSSYYLDGQLPVGTTVFLGGQSSVSLTVALTPIIEQYGDLNYILRSSSYYSNNIIKTEFFNIESRLLGNPLRNCSR